MIHMLILIHITFAFRFVFFHSLFFFLPWKMCSLVCTEKNRENRDKRLDDLGETLMKYLPGFINKWTLWQWILAIISFTIITSMRIFSSRPPNDPYQSSPDVPHTYPKFKSHKCTICFPGLILKDGRKRSKVNAISTLFI